MDCYNCHKKALGCWRACDEMNKVFADIDTEISCHQRRTMKGTERDYLQEAIQIVNGQSSLLPERMHLKVLLKAFMEMQGELRTAKQKQENAETIANFTITELKQKQKQCIKELKNPLSEGQLD